MSRCHCGGERFAWCLGACALLALYIVVVYRTLYVTLDVESLSACRAHTTSDICLPSSPSQAVCATLIFLDCTICHPQLVLAHPFLTRLMFQDLTRIPLDQVLFVLA